MGYIFGYKRVSSSFTGAKLGPLHECPPIVQILLSLPVSKA
jgi:hypothetical protein